MVHVQMKKQKTEATSKWNRTYQMLDSEKTKYNDLKREYDDAEKNMATSIAGI